MLSSTISGRRPMRHEIRKESSCEVSSESESPESPAHSTLDSSVGYEPELTDIGFPGERTSFCVVDGCTLDVSERGVVVVTSRVFEMGDSSVEDEIP
ncbi:hypothetical protein L6452_15358 [Arctium lappa]|uniref:Uncharacterized protein n=1 Tax=Arctium lappa TaxID=4217 RepID=A0ACB9CNM6_ARCLA|nr:hypothetical protein L6452_15358 [Arctium lappa]